MEKETIIELKNIRKEFPGVVALDKGHHVAEGVGGT